MIKISHPNLNDLAEEYFNALNPTINDKKISKYNKSIQIKDFFHKDSLIYRLDNKKDHLNGFYKFILDKENNFKKLKEIITSDPKLLECSILPDINEKLKGIRMDIKSITKKKNKITPNEDIINTLGYQKIRTGEEDINKKFQEIIKKLDVKVCPYCNIQYTLTIKTIKKNETKMLFDFDHFLSKKEHPYFSISFFNLLPSCAICNSRLKLTSEFKSYTHIHPYIESFRPEVKFSLDINTIGFINYDLSSFSIIIKNKDKDKKSKNNIDVFKLEEIYNHYKSEVLNIITKYLIYKESYIESINNDFSGLFKSKDEIKKLLFYDITNESDMIRVPLSKLKNDIISELENKNIVTI